jgi:hypothetical protein
MKWIILFVICLVHVLHLSEDMEWNTQGKGITYRAFHFTGHRSKARDGATEDMKER